MSILVDVTNTGAGHYLPTGITEVREMWIELAIYDKKNKEIYRSGYLDEEGILEPEAKVFRTDVKDKDGKITTKF